MLAVIVLSIRLFSLQVLEEEYKAVAEANIMKAIDMRPQRGLIYDRNGNLLVSNQIVFDITAVPNEVNTAQFTELSQVFGIPIDVLKHKLKKRSKKSVVIKEQLYAPEFGLVQDQIYRYKGISYSTRFIRKYVHNTLANTLGYVKEIDRRFLEKDTSQYYKRGDFIGKSGIEYYYESLLRGKRGTKYILVDARNNFKGSFENGNYDTLEKMGKDITITIDIDLQNYGQKLMEGKRGAIVALDNRTGEVLCIVSSPSYDPTLFAGRGKSISRSIALLSRDSKKPLFHRVIMTRYPPGSTFKTIMALIGLQTNRLDSTTRFPCNKSIVNCHGHDRRTDLAAAIQNSCNPYFFQAFYRILLPEKDRNVYEMSRLGLQEWADFLYQFGLGKQLHIDLPFENRGLVPTPRYYDKAYRNRKWKVSNIRSLSIGQGELGVTPLQMANMAAIIANRGWYIRPHLLKAIQKKQVIDSLFSERLYTNIEAEHYEFVVRAMKKITTSFMAFYQMQDLHLAGKTGTVQNPHGNSHSTFIAFAPAEAPRIAINVYVENIGDGGSWAAPIASLMVEKHLKGTIAKSRKWIEKRMLDYGK